MDIGDPSLTHAPVEPELIIDPSTIRIIPNINNELKYTVIFNPLITL
jgi:hypothetical protein